MNPATLIPTAADVPARLQPVVLGADTLAYSYARCFHEAYGITTIVVGTQNQKFVSTSRFTDYRIVAGVDQEETLLAYLDKLGTQLVAAQKVPLLLGSGDWYARIFSKNKERLESCFVVPYIDFDLLDRVTQKEVFYRICEELDIPYPKTWVYDCSDPAATIPVNEFTYPVIAKPSNSARYHYAEFEGKKKIFKVETPEELRDIFSKLQASVYDRELIVQDCIPGEDACLRTITCFCDEDGTTLVSCQGQVLLEDHVPSAIGNPVCIMSDENDLILEQAKRFLKHVGYRGFANFDVKYDERDGSYRFFEVNTRPGRNTYYMTLGGVNFVTLFVDHYILGKKIEPRKADRPFLFQMVPDYVIKRTVEEPARSNALKLIREGAAACPLFYGADSPVQRFWALLTYYNQIRKFKKYVWDVATVRP